MSVDADAGVDFVALAPILFLRSVDVQGHDGADGVEDGVTGNPSMERHEELEYVALLAMKVISFFFT